MNIMQHVEDTQKGCQQEGEEKTGNVHANEDVKDTEIFKTLKEKGKKIVGEADKSTDVYSTDDPMDGHYFDWNRSLIQQQSQDVERCSEDNATVNLDALVESVVNHNSNNTIVGTSTTVHVHNDHMDVEGVSVDIGPTTLECLISAVENLKPDNDNAGTSNMFIIRVHFLNSLKSS